MDGWIIGALIAPAPYIALQAGEETKWIVLVIVVSKLELALTDVRRMMRIYESGPKRTRRLAELELEAKKREQQFEPS